MTSRPAEADCELCDGRCVGADLTPLLVPELAWLWSEVAAAADRRGDAQLTGGPAVTVTAPADPARRAAVSGLVTSSLRAGQRVRVPLAALTAMVQTRAAELTPGAVAAHATGRRLAMRTAERTVRRAHTEALTREIVEACSRQPRLAPVATDVAGHLTRAGWVARLVRRPDASRLIETAVDVVGQVLGIPDTERFDRRLLVPGDPHALDDGQTLAGVVLAILARLGVVSGDPQTTPRSAWGQAGVDCDDLSGGLTTLGVVPAGWTLPAGVTCTIPPRELAAIDWPNPPAPDRWIFVTENPSVLAAAAALVATDPSLARTVRVVCTMGTPSVVEVAAIARLRLPGWQVAVRADFDAAGIRHVTALLDGVPDAVPWRMSAGDFWASHPSAPNDQPVRPTAWDPELATAMTIAGCAAFEEALLPVLLDDLRVGRPGRQPSEQDIPRRDGPR